MRSRIKQARERIEALRIALTGSSPQEIGAALPGLEEAARNLETVEQEIRDGACAPYEVRTAGRTGSGILSRMGEAAGREPGLHAGRPERAI